MNPDAIELCNLTKSFEYIKFSNQINSIDNIEDYFRFDSHYGDSNIKT